MKKCMLCYEEFIPEEFADPPQALCSACMDKLRNVSPNLPKLFNHILSSLKWMTDENCIESLAWKINSLRKDLDKIEKQVVGHRHQICGAYTSKEEV